MSRLIPYLLFATVLFGSGCATIVRGTTDTVYVEADSAYVFVDGVPAAVAPARLDLKRSSGHQLQVVREGFEIEHAVIDRYLNPGVAILGFLGGGLQGTLIDVSTGASFDLDPDVVVVELRPDSLGTHARRVARLVERARRAAETGFARAAPRRRRPAPWVTAQTSAGVFTAETQDLDGDGLERSGGVAASLHLGVRDDAFSARVRGITSTGILFDDSRRWELAALVGVITEIGDGRIRLEAAAGPGVSGGREDSDCRSCTRFQTRPTLPTRVGLAAELGAYVFPVSQIGLGVHLPVDLRLGDSADGLLVGLRFEGL